MIKIVRAAAAGRAPVDAEFNRALAENIAKFWGKSHKIDMLIERQCAGQTSEGDSIAIYGIRSNMRNGWPV